MIFRNIDDNTKEMLLSKAIDLFYEKGYAGASVREIVKAVKVSNSILYHYFKDKNELLYVIIERIGRELIESLRAIQDNANDPMDALYRMIRTQVGIIKEKNKEAKIFLEEQYQLHDGYKKKILKQHKEIYNIYKRQLDLLEKQGRLRDVNKAVANFSLIGMMIWSYRWYREGGNLTIEDLANAITDIFFYGILKRDRNFGIDKNERSSL